MNAMRGGAKTGWTAGLCPEPHGIRTFLDLSDLQPFFGQTVSVSCFGQGVLVKTASRIWSEASSRLEPVTTDKKAVLSNHKDPSNSSNLSQRCYK